jgi:hypothetical protein
VPGFSDNGRHSCDVRYLNGTRARQNMQDHLAGRNPDRGHAHSTGLSEPHPLIAVPRNGTSQVVRPIKPNTIQTSMTVQPNDSTVPRITTKSGHAPAKRRQREANCHERPCLGCPSVVSTFPSISMRPIVHQSRLANMSYDTNYDDGSLCRTPQSCVAICGQCGPHLLTRPVLRLAIACNLMGRGKCGPRCSQSRPCHC